MGRKGITYEQVAAAADALLGEGQEPSIRTVRVKLGDTGSANTIHRHLATWNESRPVSVAPPAPTLPQPLVSAIAVEIERAAAQARAVVESRLVVALTEGKELAAAGEAVEAERDALIEQIAALTSERDTLIGKAAQQAAELAEQAQRIEREQQAAEAARVELAKSQLKTEAQAEKVQAQALEIERTHTKLEGEHSARIEAEKNAAVLAAELRAMTDRAIKAEARVEVMEKQAQQATQELSSARHQVQAQQGALDTAVREIASAQEAVKEARAEAKQAGEEAAELRGAKAATVAPAPEKKVKLTKIAKTDELFKAK